MKGVLQSDLDRAVEIPSHAAGKVSSLNVGLCPLVLFQQRFVAVVRIIWLRYLENFFAQTLSLLPAGVEGLHKQRRVLPQQSQGSHFHSPTGGVVFVNHLHH